jgi:hypothetical protein
VIQDVRETRAIGDHLKSPRFCREKRLRSLSVFDVRCGRIPAEYRPLFIQHRLVAKQKPAIPPIFAEQAFLDFRRPFKKLVVLLNFSRYPDEFLGPAVRSRLAFFKRAAVHTEHICRLSRDSRGVQTIHAEEGNRSAAAAR